MREIKRSELTEYIRESVEASGLTYEEIAQKCGYKSDRSIRAIVSGQIPLPIDHASKIAEALGCDVDRLIVLVLKTFLPDDVILRMGRAIQKYGRD